MKKNTILTALIITAALVTSAFAHSGATGAVKKRMDAMNEIAKSTKAIAEVVTGRTTFDADAISIAAKNIESYTSNMLELFPENSIASPSEARPEIWKEWVRFSEITLQMKTVAGKIANNATSVEEIMPHFAALTKTCSACHESFRLK